MNQKIINLIQKNKTQEAIQLLQEMPLDSEQQKALSLIDAEFNLLRQEELKGTIGFEEKQIRRNRVNDKLLSIFSSTSNAATKNHKKSKRLFLYLMPILLAIVGLFGWKYLTTDSYSCPTFEATSLNKILLIPFENTGQQIAKPELLIRDKITQLTLKNNLSTTIKMGESVPNLTIGNALNLAQQCDANVIIWGKYSSQDKPNLSNLGELIVLKDITAIQKGEMLKNVEDAILSLCSIIAARQGNRGVAKKWLDKIEKQESFDKKLRTVLEK